LGHDDIAQGTLLIIVGLVLLTAIFLSLIFNQVARRTWKPFYTTLQRLSTIKLQEPVPEFPKTTIDEFNTLHASLTALLHKISTDFIHTKAFNTNASHELQTQLAVIRSSTEKLIGQPGMQEETLAELHRIYEAAMRLSQAQKSLLLLSRISNREFQNETTIDLSQVLAQAVSLFADTAEVRKITLTQTVESCQLRMDPGLADILITNLIKNAIRHNIDSGYIRIDLSQQELVIENTGLPYTDDPMLLTERFAKGPGGHYGIGLAIVKEICELYGFVLNYSILERTSHRISVLFRT
jgi:signal transduction histidine kinase